MTKRKTFDYNILRPTKQATFNKPIYGFDIETYNKNKSFLLASIVGDNYTRILETKDDVVEELNKKRYRGSLISATNLSFDFLGTFYGTEHIKKFKILWRNGNILTSKVHTKNGKFTKEKSGRPVSFIDTGNYAMFSVEIWGSILGIPKLKKPDFLGTYPKNSKQFEEMIRYNFRDSLISKRALELLYSGFIELGATPKITIASSSLSLWRNKYQKRDYFRHPEPVLEEQYNGYYGGRVEAIGRGLVNDAYFYDVNSLYPFVMSKYEYPNPNTLRTNHYDELDYIYNYEGMSKVTVLCPEMEYPILPHRTADGKLLFPTGEFTGWQTHIELREAIKLGYTIKKVHKCYYYREVERPFKEFIENLYKLRLRYKEENNPLEQVVKRIMNNLYGKYGYNKWLDTEEWLPIPDDPNVYGDYEFNILNDFVRIKKGRRKAPNYCIPIWSIYTTAYGRLHL